MEIITPIVASAVHQAVHRELDRLVRVQIYTAIEAGMAYRFAAATARFGMLETIRECRGIQPPSGFNCGGRAQLGDGFYLTDLRHRG